MAKSDYVELWISNMKLNGLDFEFQKNFEVKLNRKLQIWVYPFQQCFSKILLQYDSISWAWYVSLSMSVEKKTLTLWNSLEHILTHCNSLELIGDIYCIEDHWVLFFIVFSFLCRIYALEANFSRDTLHTRNVYQY